jgi:hypothetical protein
MLDGWLLRRKRYRRAIIAACLAAGTVVVFAATGLAGGRAPTKGPIPPNAWKADGIDKSLVPDFIPALDRNGVAVGYVAKDLAISDAAPPARPIAVYAADLETVVGHMYPGRGFVRLGASPASVPRFPVTTEGR